MVKLSYHYHSFFWLFSDNFCLLNENFCLINENFVFFLSQGWKEFKIRSFCANAEKRWGRSIPYLAPPHMEDVEE